MRPPNTSGAFGHTEPMVTSSDVGEGGVSAAPPVSRLLSDGPFSVTGNIKMTPAPRWSATGGLDPKDVTL